MFLNQSSRELPPCHDLHPFDDRKAEEYNDAEVLEYYSNRKKWARKSVASKRLHVSTTVDATTPIPECYPLEYVLYFRPSLQTVQVIHKAYPKAIESIDASNGWTVLHRAMFYRCSDDVVLYLIQHCPPYLPTKAAITNQWTPLHFACRHVCPPLVLEELIRKARCNKKNSSEPMPLLSQRSSLGFNKENSSEPMSLLSQRSSSGFTVLHCAIVSPSETTEDKICRIQLLLQADPTLTLTPTNKGYLPYALAHTLDTSERSVSNSLKTAVKIAQLGKEDYTTRHDLEAAIAKCQVHIGEAGGGTTTATTMATTEFSVTADSTVNTSATQSSSVTITASVIARHTIQILISKRKKVQSLEEIDQLIAILVDSRDKAIAENQMAVAERQQELILKLDMRKAEENVASGMAGIDDSSRQIVYGLECKGPWQAVQLSLTFLLQATNGFDPYGDRHLGFGGFGDVYRGVDPKGGTTFAVKRIKDEIMKTDQARERVKQKAQAEIKKLSELHHPNIVRLLGYHISDNPLDDQCLVYELYGGGSLADLLNTAEGRNNLDWRLRVKTATCIASALVYLHSKATFHRDVKPGNICFSESFDKVVLIDYGIAIIMDEDSARTSVEVTSVIGTRSYMAPEYKLTGIYRAVCDVFSLGVVLRTLISGNTKIAPDIRAPGPVEVDDMAGDWNLQALTELQQLMAQCCAIDPQSRPTMQELHDILLHIDQRSQPALDKEEEATINEELTKSRTVSGSGDDIGHKGDCMCGRVDVQGLVCLQAESPHFCCHSCFREHLTENLGEHEIVCREPGCKSAAYTLDQIKDHASQALLSKHLQFQRKNSQAIADRLSHILERLENVDQRVDRAVNKLMRGQELLGKDELSCPKLCFIVPTKANRGKQGIMSMVHSLRDLAQTTVLLYFVCDYDKTPVLPPLMLYKNKAWVRKVAPAVQLSILIAGLALNLNGVPAQIPVPGMDFKDQLRNLEALMSEFVSPEDAATIERCCASSVSSGRDSSAFSLPATKLADTSYQVIKEAAKGNSEWRTSMVLVQCNKTGEFGWVRKNNAEKWAKSL